MASNAFPALQPALDVLIELGAPVEVGGKSRGTAVLAAPMVGGTVKSVSGFSPNIDAVLEGTGNDYLRRDPDGAHLRLDAHYVMKNKATGGRAYAAYKGVMTVNDAILAVLTGRDDAKTTDFGNLFIEMQFETGDETMKELEHGVFVGSGRFLLENGKPPAVEYKLSRVTRG